MSTENVSTPVGLLLRRHNNPNSEHSLTAILSGEFDERYKRQGLLDSLANDILKLSPADTPGLILHLARSIPVHKLDIHDPVEPSIEFCRLHLDLDTLGDKALLKVCQYVRECLHLVNNSNDQNDQSQQVQEVTDAGSQTKSVDGMEETEGGQDEDEDEYVKDEDESQMEGSYDDDASEEDEWARKGQNNIFEQRVSGSNVDGLKIRLTLDPPRPTAMSPIPTAHPDYSMGDKIPNGRMLIGATIDVPRPKGRLSWSPTGWRIAEVVDYNSKGRTYCLLFADTQRREWLRVTVKHCRLIHPPPLQPAVPIQASKPDDTPKDPSDNNCNIILHLKKQKTANKEVWTLILPEEEEEIEGEDEEEEEEEGEDDKEEEEEAAENEEMLENGSEEEAVGSGATESEIAEDAGATEDEEAASLPITSAYTPARGKGSRNKSRQSAETQPTPSLKVKFTATATASFNPNSSETGITSVKKRRLSVPGNVAASDESSHQGNADTRQGRSSKRHKKGVVPDPPPATSTATPSTTHTTPRAIRIFLGGADDDHQNKNTLSSGKSARRSARKKR